MMIILRGRRSIFLMTTWSWWTNTKREWPLFWNWKRYVTPILIELVFSEETRIIPQHWWQHLGWLRQDDLRFIDQFSSEMAMVWPSYLGLHRIGQDTWGYIFTYFIVHVFERRSQILDITVLISNSNFLSLVIPRSMMSKVVVPMVFLGYFRQKVSPLSKCI